MGSWVGGGKKGEREWIFEDNQGFMEVEFPGLEAARGKGGRKKEIVLRSKRSVKTTFPTERTSTVLIKSPR